jgi:hypothetical protein
MKRYDPKTPRIPMALAAAVMTALTMSLLVLAPASAEIEGPATYLACRTGSGACAESCRGQSLQGDVVGEREANPTASRAERKPRQPGAPFS